MNTNVNPIADQNTIFSEVAKRMVNTALSDLTNEELIVYAFTVLPEPVHRDVLTKFTLQNRCAMTAEVYERAFAKAFELGYFVKTFSTTVKMEPMLAKAIEEAEEAKGKPVEAISTSEEMAKFIAENSSNRYSNQQLVIYALYGMGSKVDRAKLFEEVNRNRSGIDGIAFDLIIDGLVEEEIIHLAGSVILSDWFNDYLTKYMKQKANPIHLEQIAKNVVYQPEEDLSDLELLAKLFFIRSPSDESIVSEQFFARRKMSQGSIPELIKKLQELGVINKGTPVLFATSEFNERVSFHKVKFHEGIKGPTASQAAEEKRILEKPASNHPIVTLPIMIMAEKAITTGLEKNIYFESLERDVVLRSMMRRCDRFNNPLDNSAKPLYVVDYVFYALSFGTFSANELAKVTAAGLEQFGFPLPTQEHHIRSMFYDAMTVLEEKGIILPREDTSALKHNYDSVAYQSTEVMQICDEWKANGTMPGNLADNESSSGDNTKHMREGLGKCRLLEKLMPMVAARNKGIHFVDPKWTTQEYVNALVFGVLGDSYLDKVCIFNNVALLMKENRPSHDVLVGWVDNALVYFVSYNIADFNTAKEYRLTDDAIKCIKEAEERLKPKVAPFEASYKVYGKTFDDDTMLRLIDFLIAFSKVAEDDQDTVSIQGIDFNKTKALELIAHINTQHQVFDEFLKTRGVEPTFKSTLFYRNRIDKHAVTGYTHRQLAADVGDVRAPNYDPVRYRKDAASKPESDIPNGH